MKNLAKFFQKTLNQLKMNNLENNKRTEKAIKETQHLLNKEMAYSEDLRKHDRVEFYKSHLITLNGMLK